MLRCVISAIYFFVYLLKAAVYAALRFLSGLAHPADERVRRVALGARRRKNDKIGDGGNPRRRIVREAGCVDQDELAACSTARNFFSVLRIVC